MNSDAGSGINGSGSGDEEKGNEKQDKIFYCQRTWTETNTYHEDLILLDEDIYRMLVKSLRMIYEKNAISFNEEDDLFVGARGYSVKIKPVNFENEENIKL